MTNQIYTNADLQLDLQLYEGDITLQEYAERSPEYCEAFRQFCQEYGLTTGCWSRRNRPTPMGWTKRNESCYCQLVVAALSKR